MRHRYRFGVLTIALLSGLAVAVPGVAHAQNPAPFVVSEQFPPLSQVPDGLGGVGQTGAFEITPAPGSDVARYQYAWNDVESTRDAVPSEPDGRLVLHSTPTRLSLNTLYVWAIDSDGARGAGARYDFTVRRPSQPRARWSLDDLAGGVARDDSGAGFDLTATGAPTPVGGRTPFGAGAGFAGGDTLSSAGQVVDASWSFTLSAWVRLDSVLADQTVIAAGPDAEVRYSAALDRWQFAVGDAVVNSAQAPTAGGWTLLTAVYDRASGRAELFAGARSQGAATVFGAVPGPVRLGEGLTGRLDDVRVWDRVVVPWERPTLFAGVAETGRWATVTACATSPTPVLSSDAPFTFSAWAKPSGDGDVLRGPGVSLGLVDGRWRFAVAGAGGGESAVTGPQARDGVWTHVAAISDPSTGALTLRVDGRPAMSGAVAAPAHETPALSVGCGWSGSLDDVRVYTGVVPAGPDGSGTPDLETVMNAAGYTARPLPWRATPDGLWSRRTAEDGTEHLTRVSGFGYMDDDWAVPAELTAGGFEYAGGDFDGDGVEDLAVLSATPGGTAELWTVTGFPWDAAVTAVLPLDASFAPAAVNLTAGDVDGDGDDDLVAVAEGGSCATGPRTLLSERTAFAAPVASPAGNLDWCLTASPNPVLADLTGDGRDELAVFAGAAGSGVRLGVFAPKGDGTFAAPVSRWSSGSADWDPSLLQVSAGNPGFGADDPRGGTGFEDLGVVHGLPGGGWEFVLFTSTPYGMAVGEPVTVAVPTEAAEFSRVRAAFVRDGNGREFPMALYSRADGMSPYIYPEGVETALW